MLQSPFFRQMMSNPEMLRSMMQMGRGNAEQTNAFPAPGANPTTGESGSSGETTATPANPFANLFPNGIPPLTLWHCLEVLHLLLLLLPQLTTDHQKKDTKTN